MDATEKLYQRITELEKKNTELIRQNNELKVENWKIREELRAQKKVADWKQEAATSPKN